MIIELVNNTPNEKIISKILTTMLNRYGGQIPWYAPNKVIINENDKCHSHPLITLNCICLNLDNESEAELCVLEKLIHENIHWFEASISKNIERCISVLKFRYSNIEVNDYNFWLHIIVNFNTLYILKNLFKNDKFRSQKLDIIYNKAFQPYKAIDIFVRENELDLIRILEDCRCLVQL